MNHRVIGDKVPAPREAGCHGVPALPNCKRPLGKFRAAEAICEADLVRKRPQHIQQSNGAEHPHRSGESAATVALHTHTCARASAGQWAHARKGAHSAIFSKTPM